MVSKLNWLNLNRMKNKLSSHIQELWKGEARGWNAVMQLARGAGIQGIRPEHQICKKSYALLGLNVIT